MGLTKQYLRFAPSGNFNIIASQGCNINFVTLDGQEGRYVAVGACEHVIIWDLRLGERAQVLPGEKATVSYLSESPNKQHLAVGYSDGNIHVYDLTTAEVVSIFSGHNSEITALKYDAFGHKLASGSKDTDIIIWDTVSEQGLARLSGHKGPITQLAFLAEDNTLISGSKDTFVKFWDLDTQHCFKTLLGHRSEVWGLTLIKDDQYLVTGCSDAELRVWKLTRRNVDEENTTPVDSLTQKLSVQNLEDNDDDPLHPLQCHKAGSLLRAGKGRVVSISSDINGHVVACHGVDSQVELFHFLSDEDVQTRYKKRLKKAKKKEETSNLPDDDPSLQLSLRDEVLRLAALKLPSKVKSLHLVLGFGGELRVAAVTGNNSVHLYSVQTSKHVESENTSRLLRSITHHGHQSEVRAVAFSSDSLAIVSGSGDTVKLWNRATQTSLRTITVGYVLSLVFVPGDRHVLAGLKDGRLIILDIASGDVLEEIPAHTHELWSICRQPDLRGAVTGGGDKTVKFWQFELVTEDGEDSTSKAKVLSLIHKNTLTLEDSVLCVRVSPNGKFVAASLLDSTVKIFFADSLKFYLSLYGHKLPVLSMDISSDSTLIATGSGDRNIKIWGMDFGDCHKSIFAHDDSVTGVQFVPKTHYLFTTGRDGRIKEWDADSFNKIITLQGHVGESYGLAVSSNGQYVVTSGSDRVLRLYERTDQTVVLQDEEEEERADQDELATGEQTFVRGQSALNLPTRKTVGSEKACENIMECLQVCDEYNEQLREHKALQSAGQSIPPPAVPLLMQAHRVNTSEDFLISIISSIRSTDLEEALLLLPFTTVIEVFKKLVPLSARGDQTELICRVVTFLLKIHHAPIVANNSMLETLRELQSNISRHLENLRDMVGYNYYGLQYLQREIEAREGVQLFRDATFQRRKGEKKRKQREKLKRSLIVLS